MTFEQLMSARPWKPIRDCPGRYVLPPTSDTPSKMTGSDVRAREYRTPAARDPIFVVAIAGGGIISYRRADGRYIHTLNTPEGFVRKLQQLGIGY